MDPLSNGDGSGRPDTSQVDPELAEDYAKQMFWAVVFCRFAVSRKLHRELNPNVELYVAALDAFRRMCFQRGLKRGAELWKEHSAND
jgi:hypothetical protein